MDKFIKRVDPLTAEKWAQQAEDYYNGENGCPQDFEKAVEYARMAAEAGNVDAQFRLAICYDFGKGVALSHEEAARWYLKAAGQGHADAQYNLGVSYDVGDGVAPDMEKAAFWYEKSALQGHFKAQYNLGCCYENGQGVTQSYEKALEWYLKAAERGHPDAMHRIGYLYYAGKGVETSMEEALKWFQRGLERGNEDCLKWICYCYVELEDYEKAFPYLTKVTESEDCGYEQFLLGICYEKGRGVARSLTTAIEWYKKAAENDESDAIDRLEVIDEVLKYEKTYREEVILAILDSTDYVWGTNGLEQDFEKAAQCARSAAEAGNPCGYYVLSLMFCDVNNLPNAKEKAFAYAYQAADMGYAAAQTLLGNFYAKGEGGVPQSYEKAAECYLIAAEAGDEDAQFALGGLYEKGKGVPQSIAKAIEWYEKAAEQGNKKAKRKVKALTKK